MSAGNYYVITAPSMGLGGTVVSVEDPHGRIDRLENDVKSIGSDVAGLKSDMTGLKSDMRGFGGILARIEEGVAQAQQRAEHDKQASRVNPIAFASILVTIISILVGGAWTISGQLSRHDVQLQDIKDGAERMEQRAWTREHQGGGDGGKGQAQQ